MTCFYCHQPGHMRRNCTQIQGFQDQGMPQSRSLVGHEQTQYVPPYPNTGQGNRYQSQGATRASIVSQTGKGARVRVEVEGRVYRPGLRGLRGVSSPLLRRLRQQISQ